jgi:hypothetical protein
MLVQRNGNPPTVAHAVSEPDQRRQLPPVSVLRTAIPHPAGTGRPQPVRCIWSVCNGSRMCARVYEPALQAMPLQPRTGMLRDRSAWPVRGAWGLWMMPGDAATG